MSVFDGLAIGPMEYKNMLKNLYKKKRAGQRVSNMYVSGGPGIGKTSIAAQVVKEINEEEAERRETDIAAGKDVEKDEYFDKGEFIDLSLALSDFTTFNGIPKVIDEKIRDPITKKEITSSFTTFCPPRFMPLSEDRYGILFLDEFTAALPLEQRNALKLLTERKLYDKYISSRILIVGAGNRAEDKGFYSNLLGPIISRFSRFTLITNWKEARPYFVNNIHPAICSWIEFNPDNLVSSEINNSQNPRAWENCSLNIDAGMDYRTSCATAVNEGMADQFAGFADKYGEIGLDVVDRVKKMKFFSIKDGEIFSSAYAVASAVKAGKLKLAEGIEFAAKQANDIGQDEYLILYLTVFKDANILNSKVFVKDPEAYKALDKYAGKCMNIIMDMHL
jgi:hypothetical protein